MPPARRPSLYAAPAAAVVAEAHATMQAGVAVATTRGSMFGSARVEGVHRSSSSGHCVLSGAARAQVEMVCSKYIDRCSPLRVRREPERAFRLR